MSPGFEIAGGDVVEAGVAKHVVARPLRMHVAAPALDDDGELGLVLDPSAIRRIDDRIVRSDDALAGFKKKPASSGADRPSSAARSW